MAQHLGAPSWGFFLFINPFVMVLETKRKEQCLLHVLHFFFRQSGDETAEFASTHSLDVMEIHRGVLRQAVRPRQDHF